MKALKQNLPLLVCFLFLLGSSVLLSYLLFTAHKKNIDLSHSMELLELDLKKAARANQLKLDSLQEEISRQEVLNEELRSTLSSLEKNKVVINTESNEKKAAIIRIRDLDSLRNEVARHYRP